MDYQGYKLIDKIMLVCRDVAEHEESMTYYCGNRFKKAYQAYLVDPSNKKQLETARHWAKWTEYGPSYRNDEGKWVRDYEIGHSPVEFEFDNYGFELELLDCADGSSQGGKLSFWNCLVTKNDEKFVIGINSDMLLDLLKNASFINGKCQSPLIFITQKGKVGMTVEGSETYKQCIKDRELMSSLKKTQTSKYTFGDKVSTATMDEIYLGTITKYYDFDIGRRDNRYCYWNNINFRECTVTKLKNPVTYHLFESVWKDQSLQEILDVKKNNRFLRLYVKKTCPKRTITGKIKMDCTEANFKQGIMDKLYDLSYFNEQLQESCAYKGCRKPEAFYLFLTDCNFGYGFEPFELPADLMEKIKEYGIKYVEEQ